MAGRGRQTSYSYITGLQFKPIAVLGVPYFENDTFNEHALRGSLYNLAIVCFSLSIVALIVAYFISKCITRPLKVVRQQLDRARLLSRNEEITFKPAPAEVSELVSTYNVMINKIKDNKALLARLERE